MLKYLVATFVVISSLLSHTSSGQGSVQKDQNMLRNDSTQTGSGPDKEGIDFPFLSVEFWESNYQTPTSGLNDLSGLNIKFSTITSKLNYAWYPDKKNQSSSILLGFRHNYLNTDTRILYQTIDIPGYATSIPDLHSFYLDLNYAQSLKNDLVLIAGGSLFMRTDFKPRLSNQDFNYNMLFYLQKDMGHIGLGLGYITYIVDNKFRGIPMIYFSYSKNKTKLEITPVSVNGQYWITKKDIFQISGGLDFSGYSIENRNPEQITNPNFTSITKVDVRYTYDRDLGNGLHGAIGIGYLYQEMKFSAGSQVVDKLVFEDGVYISMKVYVVL